MRLKKEAVLQTNGVVLMVGDASLIHLFVTGRYTAQMGQMKTLRCVHYGNARQDIGSVWIITVLQRGKCVMRHRLDHLIVEIHQMKTKMCVLAGTVPWDTGNVQEVINVSPHIMFVMMYILLTVKVQMRIMMCVQNGTV